MNRKIISVVKVNEKGMVTTFNGNTEENLEAIGMVIASAVASMAAGGTLERDIRKQIGICVDYGMRRGLERARETEV